MDPHTDVEQELQKPKQEILRIQKIVKRCGNMCLIKYVGKPASFNTWIDFETLMKMH